MADLVKLEAVRGSFVALLDDLAGTWPSRDIADVRDDIDHGEYGLALDTMIAIAEQQGLHFNEPQSDTVRALACDMDMLQSPWVAKLSQLA